MVFNYTFRVPPIYVFNSYHTDRVNAFFEGKKGKTAVIIGNSRTRFAIPLQLSDEGFGFRYLRIVRNSSRIVTFKQIIETVLKNDADYLFIQSDFFLEDFQPYFPEFKRTVVRYLFQKDKLKNEWLENQFFSSPDLDQSIPKKVAKPNEFNEKLSFTLSQLETKGVRSDLFDELLRLVSNKKTKLVFFDVPIAKGLTDTLETLAVIKEHQQFLKTVSDGKKVFSLTFQTHFPDSLYFDFTHFNSLGRKVYFKQFIQKMDSLVSGLK